MGDTHQQKTTLPRAGTRKNDVACEIVEVQGGHMVRSTCRKDRHSKVRTAKGPRDRRVRLSAHTAIQFYDVQDRLGYDRPSKAVDWLIKKAKSAIDELAELPAWDPYTVTNPKTQTRDMQNHVDENSENPIRIANNKRAAMIENHFFPQNLQRKEVEENQNCNGSSSFQPPSSLSASLVDTIKSFFPLGASAMAVTPSSPVPFQSYPGNFPTRNGQHSEDLQLSLQSIRGHENDHVVFSDATPALCKFDEWPEQHNHPVQELYQFQRMYSWNYDETDTGNGNEFVFSSSPPPTISPLPVTLQPFSGESQFFLQRGPLQSSNTPFLRAFPLDPLPFDHPIPAYLLQPSVPSLGISDKPSSASFDSRHCQNFKPEKRTQI